jgi:hypothetical protein
VRRVVSSGVRRAVHRAGVRHAVLQVAGVRREVVGLQAGWVRREVLRAAGIRHAVCWVVGGGVRREVVGLQAEWVRQEVLQDVLGRGQAGGASGCARRGQACSALGGAGQAEVRVGMLVASAGWRCIRLQAAGIRRAMRRVVGDGVRRAVHRAAGVRREVVGLQAAWVRREVGQDASGGGQACSASGYGWRGQACGAACGGGQVGSAQGCGHLGQAVRWAARGRGQSGGVSE